MSRSGRRSIDPPSPYSAVPSPDGQALHKLIVGVDFGTTYTGISWVSTEGAHSKTLDSVNCARDWPDPGRYGEFVWKTPSRIAYAADHSFMSQNASGYEVEPRMQSYSWFKLLLDPEQRRKYDDPSLTESEGRGVLSTPTNRSPIDLCADYLAEVAKLAYQSIEKRLSAEILKATPIEFWFTVPAVWSDKAKQDTLRVAEKAAKLANLGCHRDSQLFLIREPEAAAVAALSTLTEGGSQQQVKAGDSILVCDCGGGTVDITTYEITVTQSMLEFRELVVGTGGKCGSTYIDREFIKWMENRFGDDYTSKSWEKRGPASKFMKEFEHHKRDFGKFRDPLLHFSMTLRMNGVKESVYYDPDEGEVRIFSDDLKEMFEPAISKIRLLLESQLDAERKQNGRNTIKTVILVGGFGDSTYLNAELRAWCQAKGIRLVCPEHPESAIVRGAALSGLHNMRPKSRRSRLHYGFRIHCKFDPKKHHAQDYFLWDWDNTWRAENQMSWELSKGALVEESTNVTFSFRQTVHENGHLISSLNLYTSEEDEAPTSARDVNVKHLATIHLDFSDVDMSIFRQRTIRGRRVRHVSCDVVVHFGSQRGVLCFSCTANGVEIGDTTVTFDGQSGSSGSSLGSSKPPCAVQ